MHKSKGKILIHWLTKEARGNKVATRTRLPHMIQCSIRGHLILSHKSIKRWS